MIVLQLGVPHVIAKALTEEQGYVLDSWALRWSIRNGKWACAWRTVCLHLVSWNTLR